ncbi:MAG TPA: phosphogluconate dehydrogenase (NADP(+)-dependent, decarboxylating) [Prolixibacteraceae bacterium]|jgi:6-phosphogluconate dehydrogenase|nr:phosphogluconate dehydrogenase (NADP(+)-dependent, decarboxylating) [Prolixibacteraceae bacterium]
MEEQGYDYGMIGLGTMGRNLVYNMCDHGFSVAGYDKDLSMVDKLKQGIGNYKIVGARSIKELTDALKKPRVVLLLVPAGSIVDAVIDGLKPSLSREDLVIDCGNSHFTDTDLRIKNLAKDNIHFMGIGISGGEYGARNGPSIMPGGSKATYARVSSMLEAISAKANGEPCVTYLGTGSAGHYVKMVHNGIEYALMELIAEVYQLLKQGAGMTNNELHDVFSKWDLGSLHSFLISITADIFMKKDDLTGNDLVDMILDSAHQKGTGAWTTEDAMAIEVPVPVIDISVSMRNLSALKEERNIAETLLLGPGKKINYGKNELVDLLGDALDFSFITVFAQGMELLQKASTVYKYELNLENIAAIWREGCIIRASLLEDIRSAFSTQPNLSNLMLSDVFKDRLISLQEKIRHVACMGIDTGIPLPALMASLAYYDSYRSGWLPDNLLQAQRDYFGAHTYERIDREGIFHTQWNQKES